MEQAIGRSRGGRTSKTHCQADDRGRPVAFALTPGNVANIGMALPLLGATASPKRLIADKANDVDRLRGWLKERRIATRSDRLARSYLVGLALIAVTTEWCK